MHTYELNRYSDFIRWLTLQKEQQPRHAFRHNTSSYCFLLPEATKWGLVSFSIAAGSYRISLTWLIVKQRYSYLWWMLWKMEKNSQDEGICDLKISVNFLKTQSLLTLPPSGPISKQNKFINIKIRNFQFYGNYN